MTNSNRVREITPERSKMTIGNEKSTRLREVTPEKSIKLSTGVREITPASLMN